MRRKNKWNLSYIKQDLYLDEFWDVVGFKEVSDALEDARRNTDILKCNKYQVSEICIIKNT